MKKNNSLIYRNISSICFMRETYLQKRFTNTSEYSNINTKNYLNPNDTCVITDFPKMWYKQEVTDFINWSIKKMMGQENIQFENNQTWVKRVIVPVSGKRGKTRDYAYIELEDFKSTYNLLSRFLYKGAINEFISDLPEGIELIKIKTHFEFMKNKRIKRENQEKRNINPSSVFPVHKRRHIGTGASFSAKKSILDNITETQYLLSPDLLWDIDKIQTKRFIRAGIDYVPKSLIRKETSDNHEFDLDDETLEIDHSKVYNPINENQDDLEWKSIMFDELDERQKINQRVPLNPYGYN